MNAADPGYRNLGQEPALDGIRGIAVLLVFLWHYQDDILGHRLDWVKSGHLGVDLFFVLSGFLITALMLNEFSRDGTLSFRGFYRRRVFRLMPALVVFLAAHLAWALLTDIPSNTALSPGTELRDEIPSLVAALFFAVNLVGFIDGFDLTLGLGHLWSLSVEEQFYLLWPTVTLAILGRATLPFLCAAGVTALLGACAGHFYLWEEVGDSLRWVSTLVFGLAVFGLLGATRGQRREVRALAVLTGLLAAVLMYRIGAFQQGSHEAKFFLYAGLPSRADSLIVGAVLAYLWVGRWIPYRCPTAVALVAWGFFGWFVVGFTLRDAFFFEWGWTLAAICGAFILWGSLGSEGTVYGRVLTWPWLRAIGKVAYGLYLWHVLVLIAVRYWFGDESILVKTILAVGVTAAVTTASWFLVERPMLAFKRRPT